MVGFINVGVGNGGNEVVIFCFGGNGWAHRRRKSASGMAVRWSALLANPIILIAPLFELDQCQIMFAIG